MFSVLTRVEGEMRFFEGRAASCPPASALTYSEGEGLSHGVDAGEHNMSRPPLVGSRLIYPLKKKKPLATLLAFRGVKAIFYGLASKVNLMDGFRFPRRVLFCVVRFFSFLPRSTLSASEALVRRRRRRKPLYYYCFTANLFHN